MKFSRKKKTTNSDREQTDSELNDKKSKRRLSRLADEHSTLKKWKMKLVASDVKHEREQLI